MLAVIYISSCLTLFHAGVHFAEILITNPGEILTSTNVRILSISYCKVIKTCRIGPHECPPYRLDKYLLKQFKPLPIIFIYNK